MAWLTATERVQLQRAQEQVDKVSSRNGFKRYYEKDNWRIRLPGEEIRQRPQRQARGARRLVVEV
jgi:hypothetical protein